jgi:2-dehydropantoate 2-reductase
MKIAIVGCGALGSYYGAKLCRDGHEVHFLLRSDFEVVSRSGVQITSVDGDFHVQPHCARRPEEIGPCDAVLIGLKTTANGEFKRLIAPLTGENTVIITLQNGLGNEEQLAALFGGEKIMGGLCFVCLNRTAPGQIHHLGQGAIVLGEFQRPAQPRTEQLAADFKHAGIFCKTTEDLAYAHWEKLVWNIPYNGLGVAAAAGYDAMLGKPFDAAHPGPCLATDALLADPRWVELLRGLMLETIAAAQANGYNIPVTLADKNIARTRQMGAYKASTLIDFERGLPLELDSLFLEPLRQAKKAGVPVPRMEILCAVLSKLQGARQKV